MADQPTCGQGLAEHSLLPGKFGELTASVADVLEVHTKALDLNDQNAKNEHRVYLELAKEHREIAARLRATSESMAGHRDLPMGRHDPKTMSSPEPLEAFKRLVKIEQELLALLHSRVEGHQKMLVEMSGARQQR